MQKYKVTAVKASFAAGMLLGLSKEQAAARLHALEFVKGDVYRTTGNVEFKSGEVIGLEDDNFNKAQMALLEPVEKAGKKAADKGGAEKKAAEKAPAGKKAADKGENAEDQDNGSSLPAQ